MLHLTRTFILTIIMTKSMYINVKPRQASSALNDKDTDQAANSLADLGLYLLPKGREQVFLGLAQSYIRAYGTPVY